MLRTLSQRVCRHMKSQPLSTFSYQKPERVDPSTTLRYGLSEEKVADIPEEMRRPLLLQNGSQSEINQVQIQRAIEAFERFPGDTGSSEVQIAVLTQKILYLTDHLREHRKDVHSRRGLINLVQRRRSLLKYLKRKELQKFKAVVAALNIRFR